MLRLSPFFLTLPQKITMLQQPIINKVQFIRNLFS